MTIQPPPSDEIPSTPQDDDESPNDQGTDPGLRAPGTEQAPLGAPRDEPDSELD